MPVATQTATINAGQSLSSAVDCSAAQPMRVRMPTTWVGGAKGVITFQISTDNITYMDYFQPDGKEVQAIVVPGTTTRIDHTIGGKGSTWVKIRTGSRDAPVVQSTKTDFIVVFES